MQENKKSSLLPKVPRSLSSSWPRHSEQSSEPPVYSLHAPLTSTALSAAASGPSILSLMSAAAVCLACSRHTGHRCLHHHPHLELYGLLLLLAIAAALLVLVLAAPWHPDKVEL